MSVAIFSILFALIYFAINKSLKGNRGVALVISLSLSLLITLILVRRGFLYSYTGDELGSWILIVALLIAIGFLIKVAWENFGKIGLVISVILIWVLINQTDYGYIPQRILYSGIYEFIKNIWGLIILVILALLIPSFKKKESQRIK